MIRKELLCYCLLLPVVFSTPLRASQIDDIRIVIDVSGSMVKTDPQNLRVPALKMLNGLIPTGSRAGVWTFGRYVNMEVKWGTVNERWRQQADTGAKNIHSRGQFTNIESALKRASRGWNKADSNTRRNIILLTDGKVDVSKDAEKNAQSRNQILTKSIPELVRNGIKVHAIALSSQSDEDLLKRIALDTSGSFEIAHSAEDLQKIFLRMFERAASPDTVPLKANKFSIDKSIREMTLLIFRKGDTKVQLVQPDGKTQTRANHGKNVRWRNDLGYDLITVTAPNAGEWVLDADVDESNRVMIVTDLKLWVNDLPAYTTPDQDLNLQLELHDRDKKISKNSFLKFVEFNVTHNSAGNSVVLPLALKKSREIADKGIYLQQIKAPLLEGSHEIILSADARTFQRSKRHIVEVQWPVVIGTQKTQLPVEYNLSIQARPEYLQAQTLKAEVQLKYPDGQLRPIAMQPTNDQWQGVIKANEQNGLHQLHIRVSGKSVAGREINHLIKDYSVLGMEMVAVQDSARSLTADESEPPQPTGSDEEEEVRVDEQDSGLTGSILLIAAVNVVMLMIAAGAFFYLRKKKQADDINLLDDHAVEPAHD